MMRFTVRMQQSKSIILLALSILLPTYYNTNEVRLIQEPPNIQLLERFLEQILDKNDYLKLARILLEDHYSMKTKVVVETSGNINASKVDRGICNYWLSSKGKQPVTWNTFISAIDEIGLSELATDILKQIDANYLTVNAIISSSYPILIQETPNLVIFEYLGIFDLIYDYSNFGLLLLEDKLGTKTKHITQEYSNDIAIINKEICRQWLQGEGKQPVTWRTFIQVMNITNQVHDLADDLFGLIDVNYIDAVLSLTYTHPSIIDATKKLRADYEHLALFEFNPTGTQFLNISFRHAGENETSLGHLLSIADVLSEIKYSKAVLVTGQPGTGKTTILRYLSKMWAAGRALSECEIVLFIPLHDREKVTSMEVLMGKFMNSLMDINSISKEIQMKHGAGVCFLLDSYQWNFYDDYVDKLLQGRTLNKSVRILTARPNKFAETLIAVDKYFEIVGFKKSDLPLYLKFVTSDNHTLQHAVLALWNDQPYVKELCTFPLLFPMVLSIVQGGNSESPLETRTQIYIAFVLKTIFQYKIERPYYFVKHCVTRDHPSVNMCATFKALINASFEMVFNGQQNYADRINDEILQSLKNQGFVSTETDKYTKFTFTHPTFGEFLAALHLATLPLEEQLFYATLYTQSWYSAFQFYLGIHGSFFESNITFLSPILQRTSLFYSNEPWHYSELCNYSLNVEVFELFSESAATKDKKMSFLMKEAGVFVNRTLCIYSDTFKHHSTFNFKSISNLQFTESTYGNSITIENLDRISNLTQLWYCLKFGFQETNDCSAFPGVTSFHFSVRNPDDDIELDHILQSFSTLKSLYLELFFVRYDLNLVANLLKNQRLQCIDLTVSGLPLKYGDLVHTITERQVIPGVSGLTLVGRSVVVEHSFVDMIFSIFGYVSTQAITLFQRYLTSKVSEHYDSCTVIPLKNTLMDPDKLRWLKIDGASQFQECKDYVDFTSLLNGLWKLKHLHISEVNVGQSKLDIFLKEGAPNLNLATLEISHYQIKDSEMIEVVKNLPISLQDLILVNVGLNDHSVGVLSKVLNNLTNLRSLKLKGTSMTGESLRILVTVLTPLVHLKSLDLSNNPKAFENRSSLEALAQLTHLHRLNLNGCEVKTEHKSWFLKALSNWTRLESLSFCSHSRYGFWKKDYKADFTKEVTNLTKLKYYTGWNCVV